ASPCAWADASYSALILQDGPIGYWRLGDAGTSVTATDASGNFRDGVYSRGVVNGAAGAINGDPDTAAQFDQKTSCASSPAAGNDAFNMGNRFTFEAWVINAGQGGPANTPLGRIISRGWPGQFGYGWGILSNDGMRFTTYGVKDFDSSLTVVPRDGSW